MNGIHYSPAKRIGEEEIDDWIKAAVEGRETQHQFVGYMQDMPRLAAGDYVHL